MPRDNRLALGALFAVPLVLAIALSLYFSGTPRLRATETAPRTATVAATVIAFAPANQETPTVAPTEPPTPEPTVPVIPLPSAEIAAIEDLLAGREGIYGVIIADPATGERYSTNADVPFLAASLYKLVLLADVYAAVDDGVLSLDTELPLYAEYFPGFDEPADSYFDESWIDASVPLSEALYAAGAYSSNVAAYALLALTDDTQLEAMADRLGMDHTYFHVQPPELDGWPPADTADADPDGLATAIAFAENQAQEGPLMLTTPRDVETYFTKLLAGEVVNPAVSALILEILRDQAVDDRFPCLLPPGVEMAHKTGNLDHVVHDVGIIWRDDHPVVVIAMIENPPDDAEATLVVQRLAAIAYGLDPVPSIADAFATPEISCGIVAPLQTEDEEPLQTGDEEPPVDEEEGL